MKRTSLNPAGATLVALLVAGAFVLRADAATTRNWRGGAGANWSEATNWSPGGAPENGDFLVIGRQAPASTVTNNIANLSLARLTLDDRNYVVQGDPLNVAAIVVSDGGLVDHNSITLNLTGVAQTLITGGAALRLSGNNTFTGDIDVYGRLKVESNTALGSPAGVTRVLSGGKLELAGRDLGAEVIRLSSGGTSFAEIENSLDSVIPNLEVGGLVALTSSGKLNLPNGIKQLFPGMDMYLGGSGQFLIGGTSNVTRALRLVQTASLVWNSAGQLAIVTENPFVDEPSTGDLTGSGTAASLDFTGGTFAPGSGSASGRFTLTGALELQDASLSILMNHAQTATGYSQARAAAVALGPNAALQLVQNFNPAIGAAFTIVDNTGNQPVSGTFKDLPEGAKLIRGGRSYTITYKGGNGNDVVITRAADDPRPFKRTVPMLATAP